MIITNSAISKIDISETLSKIRQLVGHTKALETSDVKDTHPSDFGQILNLAKSSLSEVSQTELHADALKQSYLSGDSAVSMAQVVVASMKSKLAFEGLMVVRNKLLEAYKEIMNMPI